MADERDSTPAAPEDSRRAQRDFRLGGLANSVLERIQQNLVRNMAVFVAVITLLVGLAVVAQYATTNRPDPGTGISLSDALDQLDNGFVEQARESAIEVRRGGKLTADELGGPAYVLGVAMLHDAERESKPSERRALYLLAASYLEEAAEAGFPAGRELHGKLLLGKAKFEAGDYSACLAPLQDASTLATDGAGEIHALLAEAYLRDSEPQLEKAHAHIKKYLADPNVDPLAREKALITGAEIQFQLKDADACRELLLQLPQDSRRAADALLMEGRLLLDEGDAAVGQSAEAVAKYRAARDAFVAAEGRNPANIELVRKARFLIGLADQRLGEYEQALQRFTRAHRSGYSTAEGMAAGFEAAEVLRALGRHEEAIESYGDVLRQALDMPVYSNSWIPLSVLKERSESAFKDYFDRSDFARAIQLANALAPLLSIQRALELQAQAHSAEAEQIQQSLDRSGTTDRTRLERGLAAWRKAAALYDELAAQRFATRQFPDLLWQSAQAYLKGHDYDRAARLLRRYIRNQLRRYHPPALTALGQANLAIGKPEEALESLTECIDFFPRDPHVYRARLLAAEANAELGQLERARQLLVDNLENGELTPRSPDWRESLYALGRIRYREALIAETNSRLQGVDKARGPGLTALEESQRLFRDSLARLSEAVKRDELAEEQTVSSETIEAKYFIAESHRQAAKFPLRRLPFVSIETIRSKLNGEIQQELGAAAAAYEDLQKS